MKYSKSSGTVGAWVKNSEVVTGTKCKLVSETMPVEGQYGQQNVAKIRFQGDDEIKNVNVNGTTINALIEAFGDDSVKWQGHVLTAVTEKSTIAGKRVTILYLIPEGYELGEDMGGYVQIQKIGTQTIPDYEPPVINAEKEEIDLKDIPF